MPASNRRSVFLAIALTCAVVWAAVEQFSVAPGKLAWLLAYCIAGALLIAACAACFIALIIAVKAMWRKLRSGRA